MINNSKKISLWIIGGLAVSRFIILPILYANFGDMHVPKWIEIAFHQEGIIEFFQELLALAILVFSFEVLLHEGQELKAAKDAIKDFLNTAFTKTGSLEADLSKIKETLPALDKVAAKKVQVLLLDIPKTKSFDELTQEELNSVEEIKEILKANR